MLRSSVVASAQAPPKQKPQSGHKLGQAPAPLREPMSTLLEPPRHLLPELGRKLKAAQNSTGAARLDGAQLKQHEQGDQQPFACALTGTSVEVLEPSQCDVEGTIPSWLEGDLYRNGPGTWDIETKNGSIYSLAHW